MRHRIIACPAKLVGLRGVSDTLEHPASFGKANSVLRSLRFVAHFRTALLVFDRSSQPSQTRICLRGIPGKKLTVNLGV